MGMVKETIIETMDIMSPYESISWKYESSNNSALNSFADILMINYPMRFSSKGNKKILNFLYIPDNVFYSFSYASSKNICELKKLNHIPNVFVNIF